jgi:subtilase family serine protease
MFRSRKRKHAGRVVPVGTARRVRLLLEELESRAVPSAGPMGFARPLLAQTQAAPLASPPGGYSPTQISHAYGFDAVTFTKGGTVYAGNGAGQTIAIVDAFGDPQIANDLAVFDSTFGLRAPPSFKMVGQDGGAIPPRSDELWAVETSLDVEWAHALAPAANILLVETNTDAFNDLFAGVRFAALQPGVSVVSMSFGGAEFATELGFDVSFTTPRGHQGVTFVAASGDRGTPGNFPALSKNVLAVGGTRLTLTSAGDYVSETGWGSGAGQLGSGGGTSVFEKEPLYQMGVQNTGMRQNPDVAFDAAPDTGVAVYDTHGYQGRTGWFVFGGTSFSSPSWAALLAISNEGRLLAQKGTLLNRQAMDVLYNLPASAFHDIVSGNNGAAAGPGYDLVTGRGTPIANKVAAGLVAASPTASSDVTSSGTVGGSSQSSPATLATAALAVPVMGNGSSTLGFVGGAPRASESTLRVSFPAADAIQRSTGTSALGATSDDVDRVLTADDMSDRASPLADVRVFPASEGDEWLWPQ